MTPSAVPQPVAPTHGFLARVTGVLFSPKETFADIARGPDWVRPLLLIMAFSMSMTVVISQRVGVERIITKELESNPRVAELPSERRQEIIERSMGVGRVMMYVAPLVFVPLSIVVISGLLLVMANFVFGAESRYPIVLSTTAYGMMPAVVLAGLAAVILFLKDPDTVDVQNIVAANLSIFVDPAEHKALYRLGMSLDLFSFWQIVLLATGLSAAARLSFKKAALCVLIPWALWVACAVGWKLLF